MVSEKRMLRNIHRPQLQETEETEDIFNRMSFKICHGICLERLGQTTDHNGQDSWCLGRVLYYYYYYCNWSFTRWQ
jgi:hypothetical protein